MKDAFDSPEKIHAISTLEEFFSWHGLEYARTDMEAMIHYALHWKHYKGRSPYTMVYFAADLRKIINACLVLEDQYCLKKAFEVAPDKKGFPNLHRWEDYMPAANASRWKLQPRSLSIPQYLNPMKALTQLRKYKTRELWMKTIDELLEYSLSTSSINGCQPPYNIMKLQRILLQMMEAAYLIFIRYQRSKSAEENMQPKKSKTK